MKRAAKEKETIDLTVTKKPRQLHQTQLQLTPRGPVVVRGEPEKPVQPDWFTTALQQRMRQSVQSQLAQFGKSDKKQQCAFNGEHAGRLKVAYRDCYYDGLVHDFMLVRGEEGPPVTEATFLHYWDAWHATHAKLRLLCAACYQRVHPRFVADRDTAVTNDDEAVPPPPVVTRLQPYRDERALVDHDWLRVASWGEKNAKGNYSRLLNEKHFTLFHRKEQWHWVYDNKFSAQGYDRLSEVIRASYETHRDTIERHCT